MPIQPAILRAGEKPQPLSASQLASEQKLVDMIVRDRAIETAF